MSGSGTVMAAVNGLENYLHLSTDSGTIWSRVYGG